MPGTGYVHLWALNEAERQLAVEEEVLEEQMDALKVRLAKVAKRQSQIDTLKRIHHPKINMPQMFEVCHTCDIDRHICPACGDNLKHHEYESGPNQHECFVNDDTPGPPDWEAYT